MQVVTAEQMLLEDLKRSGLQASDFGAYLAQETELAAVGIKPHLYLGNPNITVPGYVIPYFGIDGDRAPFYRVRLFNPLPKGARYLQPGNSGSWVYYPKIFAGLAKSTAEGKTRTKVNGHAPAILITEGEKKAAKACVEGFPTCGLGGVYNWRTKTIILPEGAQLLRNQNNQIIAKINGNANMPATSDRRAFLAAGLEQLIHFVLTQELQIVIVFDCDKKPNKDVDTAAAELAFEFRVHGVPTNRVRRLLLPAEEGRKVGLDDFLVRYGADALDALLAKCVESRTAFPAHPNLKALINQKMNSRLVFW